MVVSCDLLLPPRHRLACVHPPAFALRWAMSELRETMATEPADVTIPRPLAKRGPSWSEGSS